MDTRDYSDASEYFRKSADEIAHLLGNLQELCQNNFDIDPDEGIDWADASRLSELAYLLQKASDFAFVEGEYAE